MSPTTVIWPVKNYSSPPHAGYTEHHCRCRQGSEQDLGGWLPLRKGRLYAEQFHANRGVAAEFV